jgi:hypothetical protein
MTEGAGDADGEKETEGTIEGTIDGFRVGKAVGTSLGNGVNTDMFTTSKGWKASALSPSTDTQEATKREQ